MTTAIGPFAARILGGLALWLCLATAALAHAEFRGSDPAQDSLLQALPAAVTLRFSEPVGVLVLEWRLPDGSLHAAEGAAGSEALAVGPPPQGGRGTYVLRWRVASADGHPVGGALVFSVGEVTGAAPAADRGGLASVLARGLFVAALVLSVGAAVFHHTTARLGAGAARMAALMAGLVLPLGLVWIAVEGADRLGLAPGAAAGATAIRAGLDSPVLFTVGLAALAAPLVFAALQADLRLAAVAALILSALSFAVSGHARSAPGTLAPALTALHGAGLIVWAGGLVPLALALRRGDRRGLLARFSRVALPAVVILIGSGAGLALLHRGVPGLVDSAWARLLAAKLVLVAAMLGLALWHRFWAMPRLAAGAPAPVARSVAAEAGLGLIVLALAMGFRLAPPPSPADATQPPPVSVHLHSDRAMADLAATGPVPGSTGFRLTLTDGDFAPLDPKELRLALTDAVAGIGPLVAKAQRSEPGVWEVPPLTLPTAGPWDVRITVLISDFEQITLTGRLPAMDQPR